MSTTREGMRKVMTPDAAQVHAEPRHPKILGGVLSSAPTVGDGKRLHLTLFGGFQARLDQGPPVTLPSGKAQALLASLALPPGRAHPRDKLAALLWGGLGEAEARASLRQAL